MTALTLAPAVLDGPAWFRIDDVFDPADRTHTPAPFLHQDLDCRWPAPQGWQIVTRGGADIVHGQPGFDACDGWGASDCPDAPAHHRPVPACPQCVSGVA